MSTVNLRHCITIAVRYSAARRQFGPSDGEEIPVLEYQLQVCLEWGCDRTSRIGVVAAQVWSHFNNRIFFRLSTIDSVEQSRTIWNRSARQSFLSKGNRYHTYIILKYLRISRKLFSFCLIYPQLSCFVRKMSEKCPETVVINPHNYNLKHIREYSDK